MSGDRLTCPYCDRTFDLDQIEAADLFRERADLAARLGPHAWPLANEYLDAFRVRPGARIALKKRARHLAALVKLWETGRFEFEGKAYQARQSLILSALAAVCGLEKSGFKDHNYLKRVMVNQGAEKLSAEGLTAREEQDREQKRLFGRFSEQTEDEVLPTEELKHRAKDFVASIGRGAKR